jgi:hypothetical protein
MVVVKSHRCSTMTRLGSRYCAQQQHPARNGTWYLAIASSTFPIQSIKIQSAHFERIPSRRQECVLLQYPVVIGIKLSTRLVSMNISLEAIGIDSAVGAGT